LGHNNLLMSYTDSQETIIDPKIWTTCQVCHIMNSPEESKLKNKMKIVREKDKATWV